MDSPGSAYTRFGLELFKELNKIKDGNIFFSPVGMSTAAGMLLLGAQGATTTPLQKVVHFTQLKQERAKMSATYHIEKTEELHHQFQKVLSEISQPTNDYELKIANRLFGEKTYLFLQKYLDYVEKYYHASMETVDFVNAADESRKKINSWVESQTNEKIKDLFSDGSISNSTKLVVVNIVYFKGQWDREFKKENTKEEEFWLNKDLQAKILGIPYKNNNLSMFVLLPNDIDGLEKIIDKLSPEKLVEWTSPGQMEERSVSLHLPRFEVEDSYDLEAVLAVLGMEGVFPEPGVDSSGTRSYSGLHAQKFLHKSFVVVNEEGTEATAGTGVDFAVTSALGDESFHCSHPFLFFIRQNDSDSILFFGRFSSP
ncbi:serpin B13-like isoform X4 [Talpa occidentalis]|uniref:serpin B13-like isoform X4 n=1 Tax=Talpa occidentalis TaxID=50954 RepID=UPI00188EC546|nr:serpin B13-like isoform X4 [Talpa occidentalis]